MIGGGKGHELLWSKKDDQLEYEYCKNLYLEMKNKLNLIIMK